MAVSSVKENGVRNVRGFLIAAGKQRMLLRYRGAGEVNWEFGAGGTF
jgi:hypothetical protein